MSPWIAFKDGTARIWFHKRLIVWLYLANLVFAAVLLFPLRKLVSEISRTDLADEFVSGFQIDLFVDFWAQHSSALKSLAFSAVGLGILYLIINIFLTGGIVASLAAERQVSLRRFFYSASRYFWRYLRLFVLLAVVVGLVLAGYNLWLDGLVDNLRKDSTTDVASFLWRALAVTLVLVFVSLIMMVFDYAKIRTVVDGRRSVIFATCVAFGFSFRRFLRTVTLFYFNLVIVGILFAIYLIVENQFSNATIGSMVSLFVVQQIFIVSRIWMRLSFFATQMAFYCAATEVLPSPSPTETEPVPQASNEAGANI